MIPSTTRGGEEKAVGGVHKHDGAEQIRHQHERNQARPYAEDQRQAAGGLDGNDGVGHEWRQTKMAEEAYCAGRCENEELEARMGQEEHAERNAQNERGVRELCEDRA